jgi:putative addiction module component (TIGR02574 family)
MAEDAAGLLTHALKLPPATRAALADSLIDSLDTDVDENAEEAWRSEIALRVRDLDSGAVQTIAWEEVRRQLRGRLKKVCSVPRRREAGERDTADHRGIE